jgi:hypothetical protein
MKNLTTGVQHILSMFQIYCTAVERNALEHFDNMNGQRNPNIFISIVPGVVYRTPL